MPEFPVEGDEIEAGRFLQLINAYAYHVKGHSSDAGTDSIHVLIIPHLFQEAPRFVQVGHDCISAFLLAHLGVGWLTIGDEDDSRLSDRIPLAFYHRQGSTQGFVDVGIFLVLVGFNALVHRCVLLFQFLGGRLAVQQGVGDDRWLGAKGDDAQAVDGTGTF